MSVALDFIILVMCVRVLVVRLTCFAAGRLCVMRSVS